MASLTKRSKTYYLQWREGSQIRRRSLKTPSLQLAKEQLRQFESAHARGDANPLPTRTPIPDIIGAYVQHVRLHKTPKSAQTDIYYLRELFGAVCPELEITSRRVTDRSRKRPSRPASDGRVRVHTIRAGCFEEITTAQISDFISNKVRAQGLAAKTANRYREIMSRIFNWAMNEGRIRTPGDRNPASRVEKYRVRASQIEYLTLEQIDEHLNALRFTPQLQTMVAVLIYAGVRREELLWLRPDDINLDNGLIRIHAKNDGNEFWQPKTKLNRAVPISSTLHQYLAVYLASKKQSEWLFPSPKGKRWDPDNFSSDLRSANKHRNPSCTCLIYRHTFGSQLAQAGTSLYKISALMGNSPEIARRHYASLAPEAMHADVEFSKPVPKLKLGSA